MISKYEIFCRVIEMGSFTKTAKELGYTQSAVSQIVKTVEQELGTTLILRKKDGIELTSDGRQYFPYIQSIATAKRALLEKQNEMEGLYNTQIRIGTFTSISRNWLPSLMKQFKEIYPNVEFVLQQGEYTSITQWIKSGSIDFGFLDLNVAKEVQYHPLYRDDMLVVLPENHPLAKKEYLKLEQLTEDPFILLDEGEYSVPLKAFEEIGKRPNLAYKVTDDYSILAMVKEGLGITMLYHMVLAGYGRDLVIRPVKNPPNRIVSIAWNNWDTMPLAARRFAEFIMAHIDEQMHLYQKV